MKTRCVFCGEVIDADAPGVYQKVTGWERRRSQGGTNALRLPERQNEWACHGCIERLVKVGLDQGEMF